MLRDLENGEIKTEEVEKLNKAERMLKCTNMSVTEIAYEVGMSGASYFAETLKKCRGCSPSQIRKEKER